MFFVGKNEDHLRLGLFGTRIKSVNGQLRIRNSVDKSDAAIIAEKISLTGNIIEINSDAEETGSDWKYTLQRPTSGMTASIVLTLPSSSGIEGQSLTTDGAGNLSWKSSHAKLFFVSGW